MIETDQRQATCPECEAPVMQIRGPKKIYCSRKCFLKNYTRRPEVLATRRNNNLKYKWGMTTEEYLDFVSGGCEICGSMENLVIDHDHACCPSNGKMCGSCTRGVMCKKCNAAEGLLNGDPELAVRLAEYMKRTNNVS